LSHVKDKNRAEKSRANVPNSMKTRQKTNCSTHRPKMDKNIFVSEFRGILQFSEYGSYLVQPIFKSRKENYNLEMPCLWRKTGF
jgi:hypothetical protein